MKICFVALFAVLTILAVSPIGTAISNPAAAVPAPTPINPVAAPGSVLQHNQANTKPGFKFVKSGAAANVVNMRHENIVGRYVCVSDKTGVAEAGCNITFDPHYLSCKGQASPSNGRCMLTSAPQEMQP
jgi:hypothetical protein